MSQKDAPDYGAFTQLIQQAEAELAIFRNEQIESALETIPDAWRLIEVGDHPKRKLERATLYIDKHILDVLRRGTRPWQEQARTILRSFIALRASAVLNAPRPKALDIAQTLSFNTKDDNPYWYQHLATHGLAALEEERVNTALKKIARALGEYDALIEEIMARHKAIDNTIDKTINKTIDKNTALETQNAPLVGHEGAANATMDIEATREKLMKRLMAIKDARRDEAESEAEAPKEWPKE